MARIIMAWDPTVLDVSVLFSSEQMIVARVFVLEHHKTFFLSTVYGHNQISSRRDIWSDMRYMHSVIGGQAWMQLGDFNAVSLDSIWRGLIILLLLILIRLDFINMDDMPTKGFWYTWSNQWGLLVTTRVGLTELWLIWMDG